MGTLNKDLMMKELTKLALDNEATFNEALEEMFHPRESKPEAASFKIAFANPSIGIEILAPTRRDATALFKLALSRVNLKPTIREVR